MAVLDVYCPNTEQYRKCHNLDCILQLLRCLVHQWEECFSLSSYAARLDIPPWVVLKGRESMYLGIVCMYVPYVDANAKLATGNPSYIQ